MSTLVPLTHMPMMHPKHEAPVYTTHMPIAVLVAMLPGGFFVRASSAAGTNAHASKHELKPIVAPRRCGCRWMYLTSPAHMVRPLDGSEY